jgi:hypothetical protein
MSVLLWWLDLIGRVGQGDLHKDEDSLPDDPLMPSR